MIDVRAEFPIEPGWPRLAMDWDIVRGVVIHHTAVDPRTGDGEALLLPAAQMTQADELNHIRVIHLYHKSIGYGGFGYHFIVFPSGRSYYVVSLRLWGAHVAGRNHREFGLAFAGDFGSVRPRSEQFQGAQEPLRLADNALGRCIALSPHNLWTNTTCPGLAWPLPEEDEMTPEERVEVDQLKADFLAFKRLMVSEEREAALIRLKTDESTQQARDLLGRVTKWLGRAATRISEGL
jgi:hypothetical protein